MPGLGAAVGLGQPAELAVDPVADHGRLHAHPGEDGHGDAVGLAEHGGQQVVRGDLGVVGGPGPLDGGGERLLGLERPAVGVDASSGLLRAPCGGSCRLVPGRHERLATAAPGRGGTGGG